MLAEFRYRDRGPDIVPLADRLAVKVPGEFAKSLVDFLPRAMPWFRADALAWDLHRLYGRDLGEALHGSLSLLLDDRDDDAVLAAYAAAATRGRCASDKLLIDVADQAEFLGLAMPPELHGAWERLRDLAEAEANRNSDTESTAMPVLPFPAPATPAPDLIRSSAEFVQAFTPPNYMVDGIFQLGFFYSITGQTGAGKTAVALLATAHVAIGRPLGSLHVERGTVLYFAGENPIDVQMRWLGLTHAMGLDPAMLDAHFVTGAMSLSEVAERITQEVARKGLTLTLVVVDTSAAYFETDDENSNTQVGAHARRLRSLTTLPGGPCVITLTHPTKRAADDDLLPRGGGAFLAEVDGNIALRRQDSLVVAVALGKFRGPEFPPLSFELQTVTHPLLKDTRGRNVPTVIARPLDDAGRQAMATEARRDEDSMLRAIEAQPSASLSDLARVVGWRMRDGKPYAVKAKRAVEKLHKDGLIHRHRDAWALTAKGEKELNRLERKHPATPSVNNSVQPQPILPPIKPPSSGA